MRVAALSLPQNHVVRVYAAGIMCWECMSSQQLLLGPLVVQAMYACAMTTHIEYVRERDMCESA